MLSQFRLAAFSFAALSAAWGGAALAQWPTVQHVVRVEPGYGGVCEQCDLSGRILAGARLINAVFDGSDFSNAVLTRVDASGASFAEVDFTGADLSRSRFIGVRCTRAQFRDARLSHIEADRGNFERAHFEGAELTNGSFQGARFVRARFHLAQIDGANFSAADLRFTFGLTQRQLSTACGDANTRLPEGLRIPYCDGSASN